MKVSVVIPTHNRAHLISKALESVINQTYKNLEIIVVSDGSTDETDRVLQKYQMRDDRIKYLSYHPNRGGNYARNLGITNSTGEYISFLDDDDEWEPKKIELQIKEFIKNPDVGLVYTGVRIVYGDKQLSYKSLPKKTGNISNDILISNYIGTTSSVLVKSNIINECGGFDEELNALQDYDLWIRICQITNVSAVSKPLVNYHNFNTTVQISDDIEKYIKALKYIKQKYASLYFELRDDEKLRYEQACYMLLVNKCIRNNKSKSARKYLIEHLKIKPTLKAVITYLVSYFNYDTILKIRSIKS